jgi:hypothetical protein
MWDLVGSLIWALFDVPLIWTGERVLYVLSAGRRKPRFTAKELAFGKPGERLSEFLSRFWLFALGFLFWVAVLAALVVAFGPLNPIHEWRS